MPDNYIRRYSPKRHRDWLEYLSIGISIVTLVAAFGAATAAGLAARFTYGQWNTAYETEHTQLRAYINSPSLQFIHYGAKVDGKIKWIVSLIIENTGETGTRHMKINSTIGIDGKQPVPFDWSNLKSDDFYLYVLPSRSEQTAVGVTATGEYLNTASISGTGAKLWEWALLDMMISLVIHTSSSSVIGDNIYI